MFRSLLCQTHRGGLFRRSATTTHQQISSCLSKSHRRQHTLPKSSSGSSSNKSTSMIAVSADVEMIAANNRMAAGAAARDHGTIATSSSSFSSLNSSTSASSSTASIATRSYSSTSSSRAFSAASSEASSSSSSSSTGSSMQDEYGRMDAAGESYAVENFALESGAVLPRAELRYRTYGRLNAATRDNAVVVCHALTGNASLDGWWGDLLGPGRAFDTSRYFVVCCNILGSCYGSTSPASVNPATGRVYGVDFPDVSVQDTVRLQLQLLRRELQIESVRAVIGGSFGGMQAVEFAVQAGSRRAAAAVVDGAGQPYVKSVVPIACNAQHAAWQIAISEVQRQAIYRDPAWRAGDHGRATQGLQVARQLGMISYRTPAGYATKFGRQVRGGGSQNGDGSSNGGGDADSGASAYGKDANWQVASYLVYQGEKFVRRFDPVTYVKLTEQMDSHDVARGRGGSVAEVLRNVEIPALVLGIDSDVLYPLEQQRELARLLPRGEFAAIRSDDGHDGFLLEQEQVGRHITDFLNRQQQAEEEEEEAEPQEEQSVEERATDPSLQQVHA